MASFFYLYDELTDEQISQLHNPKLGDLIYMGDIRYIWNRKLIKLGDDSYFPILDPKYNNFQINHWDGQIQKLLYRWDNRYTIECMYNLYIIEQDNVFYGKTNFTDCNGNHIQLVAIIETKNTGVEGFKEAIKTFKELLENPQFYSNNINIPYSIQTRLNIFDKQNILYLF